MPKLTKAQQRLVDIIEEGGAEVILSRYSRNPYIYIYYKNKKPSVLIVYLIMGYLNFLTLQKINLLF